MLALCSREQQQLNQGLNGRLAMPKLYYIATHDTIPAKHKSHQINLAIVCDTSLLTYSECRCILREE